MPTKEEVVKLGKLYLYLVILGFFIFLMVKPLNPVNIAMGNNLLEVAKISVQAVITNSTVKQISMLFLLMYTIFVGVESFIMLRDCGRHLYYKNKGDEGTVVLSYEKNEK